MNNNIMIQMMFDVVVFYPAIERCYNPLGSVLGHLGHSCLLSYLCTTLN